MYIYGGYFDIKGISQEFWALRFGKLKLLLGSDPTPSEVNGEPPSWLQWDVDSPLKKPLINRDGIETCVNPQILLWWAEFNLSFKFFFSPYILIAEKTHFRLEWMLGGQHSSEGVCTSSLGWGLQHNFSESTVQRSADRFCCLLSYFSPVQTGLLKTLSLSYTGDLPWSHASVLSLHYSCPHSNLSCRLGKLL